VDMLSPFLAVIAQDPVLRRVKLIAEPWDVGSGGYQVGAFPPLWTEWNDRYRDAVRDFWRGALPDVRDLGYRLTGSSDLYAWGGRRPYASVNFVAAHDGFTLRDLVSSEHKHNEANGEGNRDGTSDNRAWNCGAEGESDDPEIN
ncbi:glycogen debranching enzyme GlgX, partial [Streptomyces sp. DSM 41635]|nr:glycogen debranching enzyme GlgX [Streptomyces sp. DSM 41635]